MKTIAQIAAETVLSEYGFPTNESPEWCLNEVLDMRDDQTAYDLLDTIQKAIEAYREQVIADMAERAHRDNWGVPCIYVESYAEHLRKLS